MTLKLYTNVSITTSVDQRFTAGVCHMTGSAADVNELQSRDEIVSVNKVDITQLTNESINQLVEDAVRSGHIELRVRRFVSDQGENRCLRQWLNFTCQEPIPFL